MALEPHAPTREEPGVHGAPGDASNEGGSKGVVAKVEETDTDMYQVERAWLQGVYARCKFGQKSFAATKDQGVNVQQDVYHVERAWLHRIYMRCKIGERAASTEEDAGAIAGHSSA